MKIMNQESLKSGFKSHENHEQSILTLSYTNFKDTESSQSQSHTEAPQKLSIKKKTDMTATFDSDSDKTINEPKDKKTSMDESVLAHRQTEATKYNEGHYNSYKFAIQENIDYGSFIRSRYDIALVDGLIETMLDVICTESPATIKMGDETKAATLFARYI